MVKGEAFLNIAQQVSDAARIFDPKRPYVL